MNKYKSLNLKVCIILLFLVVGGHSNYGRSPSATPPSVVLSHGSQLQHIKHDNLL